MKRGDTALEMEVAGMLELPSMVTGELRKAEGIWDKASKGPSKGHSCRKSYFLAQVMTSYGVLPNILSIYTGTHKATA